MIKKTIRMSDCVGKYATLDHSIKNGAGQCIKKGSKVKIVDYGRSLSIKTNTCTQCGQSCYIRGVKKEELTLCTENEDCNTKWIKVNAIIQCDKCGFGMYPTGYFFEYDKCIRANDNTYRPNFCPNCGRNMKNEKQTHE